MLPLWRITATPPRIGLFVIISIFSLIPPSHPTNETRLKPLYTSSKDIIKEFEDNFALLGEPCNQTLYDNVYASFWKKLHDLPVPPPSTATEEPDSTEDEETTTIATNTSTRSRMAQLIRMQEALNGSGDKDSDGGADGLTQTERDGCSNGQLIQCINSTCSCMKNPYRTKPVNKPWKTCVVVKNAACMYLTIDREEVGYFECEEGTLCDPGLGKCSSATNNYPFQVVELTLPMIGAILYSFVFAIWN